VLAAEKGQRAARPHRWLVSGGTDARGQMPRGYDGWKSSAAGNRSAGRDGMVTGKSAISLSRLAPAENLGLRPILVK